MAKKPDESATAGPEGRRASATRRKPRKPVTIDLSADDVTARPAGTDGDAGDAASDRPGAAKRSATASGAVQASATEDAATGAGPDSQTESPAAAAAVGEGGAGGPRGTGSEASGGAPSDTPPIGFRRPLAVGLAGGLVALAVIALLAGPRLFGGAPDTADLAGQIDALRGELDALREATAADRAWRDETVAALRQTVDDLSARSLTDPAATLEDFTGRLAAFDERDAAAQARLDDVEAAVARLDGLAPRLARLEQEIAAGASGKGASIDDLASRIDRLERAPPTAGTGDALAAVSPELDAIRSRIDTIDARVAALGDRPPVDLAPLDSAVTTMRGDLAALSDRFAALDPAARIDALAATVETAGASADRAVESAERAAESAAAVAPAIAALSLADALAAGRPFTLELEAARRQGAAGPELEVIVPHAETGLPTLAALSGAFARLVPSLVGRKAVPDEAAGALDRIIRSARDLVEVRPAGPLAGDDRFAIVSRISAHLANGDLEAALADWERLSGEEKDLSRAWAGEAAARRAGDRLAETLREAAVARLAAGAAR